MNWKKRKKLRQKLHHYQSKRVKSLIRLMNNASVKPFISKKTRTVFFKFCKQHPLHDYDVIVRKKAIRKKPELPSVPPVYRVYDYNTFMNVINNDKRITTLMESRTWRGEIEHPPFS